MLKGIDIILYDKIEDGKDAFGTPVYKEVPINIKNVLVAPVSADDSVDNTSLKGKRIVYEIAIPKGDSHIWKERTVEFFGQKFDTIGVPLQGIESLVPLRWNKKIKVERYE